MLGPDEELIKQETEGMENLTEGQLAEYIANEAMHEPNCD